MENGRGDAFVHLVVMNWQFSTKVLHSGIYFPYRYTEAFHSVVARSIHPSGNLRPRLNQLVPKQVVLGLLQGLARMSLSHLMPLAIPVNVVLSYLISGMDGHTCACCCKRPVFLLSKNCPILHIVSFLEN